MIVVVAALRFETQEARDRAVDVTREVQLATREDEAGCYDYCFAPEVNYRADNKGGDERPHEGERENGFEVPKETRLLHVVPCVLKGTAGQC